MKRLALAACVIVSGFAAPLAAADWKPAKGPLFTRWAKDVSPDKVLLDELQCIHPTQQFGNAGG